MMRKNTFKVFISWLVLLMVIATSFSIPIIGEASIAFDGTQSDWAEKELNEAFILELTNDKVLRNFKANITREEFSNLAVLLYEKLTGELAEFYRNPFTDTTNPGVLKAYDLGIVKGTSATTFSPNSQITRQEICTMIMRTLTISKISLTYDATTAFPFTDANQIKDWAKSSMKMAYQYGIMLGLSPTTINPLQNTTREQGIVLVKRAYQKITGTVVAVEDKPVDIATTTAAIVFNGKEITDTVYSVPEKKTPEADFINHIGNDFYLPEYDNGVELFISTLNSQPTKLPSVVAGYQYPSETNRLLANKVILPAYLADATRGYVRVTASQPSVFTKNSGGVFINTQSLDTNRWVVFQSKNNQTITKVVWQVASAPFIGQETNWQSPVGLIAHGEVQSSQPSFQIDFKAIIDQYHSSVAYPKEQDYLYIRGVGLTSSGTVVGQPGKGFSILVGKPEESVVATAEPIVETLSLYTTSGATVVSNAEFPDKPSLKSTVYQNPLDTNKNNRIFTFSNFPAKAQNLIIQVSTAPFNPQISQWPNTPDLVYEGLATLPTNTFQTIQDNPLLDKSYPGTVSVPFHQFAPKRSNCQSGEYIKYYVRGVAILPSGEPGTVLPQYTNTVEVLYGYDNTISIKIIDPEEALWLNKTKYPLEAAYPYVSVVHYSPPIPADPESMRHYVVYRTPSADEVTVPLVTSAGFIMPYNSFMGPKMSKAEYQNNVVNVILKEGTKVYFPPPQKKDKPWYDEIIDGVVGFFGDLISLASTLTNQIANAYNSVKKGIIDAIVNLCPVDSWKGAFRAALEAAAAAGLIACGLPPSLPNFDELLEGNLEYLAKAALTEAGMPQNAITDAVVAELASEMGEALTSAANVASPNPANLSFLQLDPDYAYKPGYVDIKVENVYDVPSVPGHLNLEVTFEMDYYSKDNLSLTHNLQVGAVDGISDYLEYLEHFAYDMNNNMVKYDKGQTCVYEVFTPIKGQSIPTLGAKETEVFRVYLEEHLGASRYNPETEFNYLDYYNVFYKNGNGDYKFTYFNLNASFMPPEEFFYINMGHLFADPQNYYYYFKNKLPDNKQRFPAPICKAW